MSVVTYYFNSYDVTEAWSDTPEAMTDGDDGVYTGWENNVGRVQKLTGNTFDGTGLGKIGRVELRVNGYCSGGVPLIQFRPIYNSTDADEIYNNGRRYNPGWVDYVDITNDANAPTTWTWEDITNLQCDVITNAEGGSVKVSKVEIRVSYNEITYYFDAYDESAGEEWDTNPGFMVNSSLTSDATTNASGTDTQLLVGNTCDGTELLGDILTVELRCYGKLGTESAGAEIELRPVFFGLGDGDTHASGIIADTDAWSGYIDITNDTNAPATWDWDDIKNLNCDVDGTQGVDKPYCAKVEIRVTFTSYKKTGNFFGNPF